MQRRRLARHPRAFRGPHQPRRSVKALSMAFRCGPEPGRATRIAAVAPVELDQGTSLALAFRIVHGRHDRRGVVASHVLDLVPDRSLH
jgi:hypothetical protein